MIDSGGHISRDLVQERGVVQLGVIKTINGVTQYWQSNGDQNSNVTDAPVYQTDMANGVPLYLREWKLDNDTSIMITTADPNKAKRASLPNASLDLFGQSAQFSLRASNGLFVTGVGQTQNTIVANASTIASDQTYTVAAHGGPNRVSLRVLTSAGDRFVSAEQGGGGAVHANRAAASIWETFEVISLGNNQAALRTFDGVHYLGVTSDGTITAASTSIGAAQIFELVNVSSDALVNVALGKSVTQSTNQANFDGTLAVDGVLTGNSISHTAAGDFSPYFEVDLGQEYPIERIEDYTRENCCTPTQPERDYNIRFEILDSNHTVVYTSHEFNSWDGTNGSATDLGNGAVLELDLLSEQGHSVTGRYVRVTKDAFAGSEFLSIAELRVIPSRIGQYSPVVAEYGTVTGLTDATQTIVLDNVFANPVVIAGPVSTSGSEPPAIRISNVKTVHDALTNEAVTSFDIRLQEPIGYDNTHAAEAVSYIVVESGRHVLPDGTVMEAGNTLLGGVGTWSDGVIEGNFTDIAFDQEYDQTPLVFAQTQTYYEQSASGRYTHTVQAPIRSDATIATPTSSASGVRLALEREEGQNGELLIDASQFTLNGSASVNSSLFNSIQLTPSQTVASGSAWIGQPISAENGYSFAATMLIDVSNPGGISDEDGPGGDGMAFVLQSGGLNVLGDSGGTLGLPPSSTPFVAIEFDSFQGGAYDGGASGSHIGIDTSLQGNVARANVPRFNGNSPLIDVRNVWIEYDGVNDRMDVYFRNSNVRPSAPTLSASVDLESIFGNSASALSVGWTASTGLASNVHSVLQWGFRASETVGWLAVDPGPSQAIARPTGEVTTDFLLSVLFDLKDPDQTDQPPSFIGSIIGNQDVDTPILRYRNPVLTSDGSSEQYSVDLHVQEENSFDAETSSTGGAQVNLWALPGARGTIGGIPLRSYVPSDDPINQPGQLLWRDAENQIIAVADGAYPSFGYGVDNGHPVVLAPPQPSLVQVTRSVSKPLVYSVDVDVVSTNGRDTIVIDGSDSDVNLIGSFTAGLLTLRSTDADAESFGTQGRIDGVDSVSITLGAGDDYFVVGEDVKVPVHLNGRGGDDVLVGGSAGDHLIGGLGDDTLIGGLGNDTIQGGLGNDRIAGDIAFTTDLVTTALKWTFDDGTLFDTTSQNAFTAVGGTAFGGQPIPYAGNNVDAVNPLGGGEFLVRSDFLFDSEVVTKPGDSPQGTLQSQSFVVGPGGMITMQAAGNGGRVELVSVATGAVLESLSPGLQSVTLAEYSMDVSKHAGRLVAIRIVDDQSGGWGHIAVDNITYTSSFTSTSRYRQLAGTAIYDPTTGVPALTNDLQAGPAGASPLDLVVSDPNHFLDVAAGGDDILYGGLGQDILLGQWGDDQIWGDDDTTQSVIAFDFGTNASPVASGFVGIGSDSVYREDVGYGWDATVQPIDDGASLGDDLERDLHAWGAARTFMVDLDSGVYDITLYLGEKNANALHEDVGITLEGKLVETVSSPAGEVVRRTYERVAVVDGQLSLMLDAPTAWAINGFEIWNSSLGDDDYIEGNGGNDLIVGGAGQDDLIGGSSELFGLTNLAARPDGADTIYGAQPTQAAPNDLGDLSSSGHARDADTVLGDNGNIYRLVNQEATLVPVSYLPFDDPGSLAIDRGSFGNDGVVAAALHSSDAMLGQGSLLLDGGGLIQIPGSGLDYSSLEDNFSGFTIAAWVNADSFDGDSRQQIFGADLDGGTQNGSGWGVGFDSNGGLFATAYGVNDFLAGNQAIVTAGDWHHLAFVFNPGPADQAESGSVDFYLDGTLLASITGNADVMKSAVSDGFAVGGLNGSNENARFFSGRIDDLRVYDVPLDHAQVAGLLRGGYIDFAYDDPYGMQVIPRRRFTACQIGGFSLGCNAYDQRPVALVSLQRVIDGGVGPWQWWSACDAPKWRGIGSGASRWCRVVRWRRRPSVHRRNRSGRPMDGRVCVGET